MANADSKGPVICAWCSAELKRGGLSTPLSHGICLPCMAAVAGDPIEDLSHVRSEVLDALPYGAIQLAGDGIVTGYSRGESELSGLSPGKVIGKNFFRQVAPCTAVKEFQGAFDALRAKRENGRATLRFVFTFARGSKLVEIAMVYHAATDTGTLLVRVVLSEPRL
jgi:photoactive yellow protein